jgi:hypothetical protein
VGQAWIDHDQVLLLLDGLDEVREDTRDACVEAINAYRQEHGMVGMVVCSRVADYAGLTTKLKLRGAIMVQPLTDTQIDSYLAQTGDQLATLRTLLQQNNELRELARIPLMLSIMTIAYRGQALSNLPERASLNENRRHLFGTYVERMLKRRGGSKHYTPEQTQHWLSWLAGRLNEHSQTVFYLEKIQPDWLTQQRWLYQLTVKLVFGLVFGLVGGLIFGLVGGLIFGLVGGLIFGLGDRIKPAETVSWSWRMALRNWWQIPLMVVVSGLASWLQIIVGGGWQSALGSGLVFGLVFGLVSGIGLVAAKGIVAGAIENRTLPNEALRRSYRSAMLVGLGGGLIIGLVFGLVFGLSNGLVFGLSNGLIFGLVSSGGAAVIKHYILRVVLWQQGVIPLNYIRFLDYAAERILLRKVGGGYIFVHRILLEYFASLEDTKEPK